jgi:hypothetical protein
MLTTTTETYENKPFIEALSSVQKPANHKRSFRLLSKDTMSKRLLQAYIADKYLDCHQAKLEEFLPMLIEMSSGSRVLGGVGLQFGGEQEFFLQQYSQQPVLQTLETHCQQKVDAHNVAEIGNLAVTKPGQGSLMISLLAKSLESAGFEWMLFTATQQVQTLVTGLGGKPIVFCQAKQESLCTSLSDWGNYYQTQPKVMALKLSDAIDHGMQSPRVQRMFESYQADIEKLSSDFLKIKA